MQTSKLVRLTVKELQDLAKKLKIEEISGVRKQDLIKLILESEAKKEGKIYADGVLEVMPDGYLHPHQTVSQLTMARPSSEYSP